MINSVMSKSGRFAALGLLLLTLAGCPCLPGTDFVYFPDKGLESAVRAAINKPFGCLSTADLAGVRTVNASGLGVRVLEGIEKCRNLTDLDLSDNSIKSIAELSALENLVYLDLARNNITRIDALTGLFFLRYLDVSGEDNDIRDFSPLATNAINGGIGDGTTVTVSSEWTVQTGGELFSDFADDYAILINAGVTVIFADTTGGGGGGV